jgi:hypothetical protein
MSSRRDGTTNSGPDLASTAYAFYEFASLNVIPCWGRNKQPAVKWKDYKTERVPEQKFNEWFMGEKTPPGLAIITGYAFHGSPVELFEFETDWIKDEFKAAAEERGLGRPSPPGRGRVLRPLAGRRLPPSVASARRSGPSTVLATAAAEEESSRPRGRARRSRAADRDARRRRAGDRAPRPPEGSSERKRGWTMASWLAELHRQDHAGGARRASRARPSARPCPRTG